MADETKAPEKAKIKLRFLQAHTHKPDADPKNDKQYKPGDVDMFTQSDADTIRGLGVAQTVS